MRKLSSKISIAVFLALVSFLIAAFALPAMPAQADSTPECWGVFVGVSDYQYISDLSYCDDDARDLSNILSPVWGSSHVTTLIDSQASKAGILDAIDWLADNAGAEDTVLFTFSGHGSSLGYICPYNALAYSYANDISTTELANAINEIAAGKIVVVLDSCFAGKFQSSLSSNGRVILMACASSELSWDSPSKRNGVFSYYVIKALEEFDIVDANGDYELSAEEIAQYANPLTTVDKSTMHPVLDDRYSGQLALLAKFVFKMNLYLPLGTVVLTLDGNEYKTIPSPMIWVPGVSRTMTVPELIDMGKGTRYVFTKWDDGSVTATRIITKGSYTANYDREHFLKVISAFGETGGDGWYKEGDTAGFSVTDYIELPDTKHIFTGWSGDYTGTEAIASLTMAAPSTVTASWRHEYLLTLNSEYGTLTCAG